MKRLQRVALVTELVDRLQSEGSWSGETHIQKAVFVLETLARVPIDYNFVLYKFGPFSFELRDELNQMRGDGWVEYRRQPYPYGPSLIPTSDSQELRKSFPVTLRKYDEQLNFVVHALASKNAAELERVTTALLIASNDPQMNQASIAKNLQEVKPHIDAESAEAAVQALKALKQRAREAPFDSPEFPGLDEPGT